MSLGIELKRTLDAPDRPFSKRLKLAEHISCSSYHPVLNKNEIILDWIFSKINNCDVSKEIESLFVTLKNCFKNPFDFTVLSNTFISKTISVLSGFLQQENKDKILIIECCLNFLENACICSQMQHSINDYFGFQTVLLENLSKTLFENVNEKRTKDYESLVKRLMTNISNFTKNFSKKVILVESFIDCGTLSVILELSNNPCFNFKALNICQSILFQKTLIPVYRSYLGTLIKGNSVASLIEEKGEQLKTVMKTLNVVLKYKNTEKDTLLANFTKLFLFSCKSDEMVVCFFYILLYRCIGIQQDYVLIHGDLNKIEVDKADVQKIYLKSIQLLMEHNINLNITFSNNAAGEDNKNFITFLQQATLNVLKEKKTTANSLLILQNIILLDPSIFEPLIAEVLPKICTQPKDGELFAIYNTMMLTVLNIQFKLSRGTEFIPKIMPYLKESLESIDNEQSESMIKNGNCKKKTVVKNDIFTNEFCLLFGKLSSDLMSWQNVNVVNSLTHMLHTFSIKNLSAGSTSPSVIVITELICSLFNSFFFHTKMADQNLPQTVVKKFVDDLEKFEAKILGKLGRCIMSTTELRLIHTYLDMCYIYGQFKLLLCRYQPYYACSFVGEDGNLLKDLKMKKIGDISILHSYLSCAEWKDLFNMVKQVDEEKYRNAMNRLILQKLTMLNLVNDDENAIKMRQFVRMFILENLQSFWDLVLENDLNGRILLTNLTDVEADLLVNKIVEKFFTSNFKRDQKVLKILMNKDFIMDDKMVLSKIVLKLFRSFCEIVNKHRSFDEFQALLLATESEDFDLKIYLKQSIADFETFVMKICNGKLLAKSKTIEKFENLIEFLTLCLPECLPEKFQHMVLFIAVTLKIIMKNEYLEGDEKIENLDLKLEHILLKIYELCYKTPNMFDIIPFEIVHKHDVLQLTTRNCDKYRNHYEISKLTFERFASKEHFQHLKGVMKFLKKTNKSCTKSDIEKLCSSSFQIISGLYVCLTNLKKGPLPSDVKAVVVSAMTEAKDIVLNVYCNIKWKSLIKENIETNADADVNYDLAKLNLIESYAMLVQNELTHQEENTEFFNGLKKGFKIFIQLAKNCLKRSELHSRHAKGCASLLNTFLKNVKRFLDEKFLQNHNDFYTDTLSELIVFMRINDKKTGETWAEAVNINKDNIKLIFEVTDEKVFSNIVTKYCSLDFSVNNTVDSSSMAISSILWTCLLNANLKYHKSEIRSNALKEICASLRELCSTVTTDDVKEVEEDGELVVEAQEKNVKDERDEENIEKLGMSFQAASQFVSMKKVLLPNVLLDNIIQMAMILHLDPLDDKVSVHLFVKKFDMCFNLLNGLLIHRSELLQDRWPCFLQAYRKLVKCLCLKSNADKITDEEDIEKLISSAMNMERITQSMVKNEKQELSRISSYLVADIINSYYKIPILPDVKFHMENCVYSLLELMDAHSIGFLMRNIQDTQRLVFQQLHKNYNKYYKYTGKS